jgi:hypothetical protein
MAIFADSHVCRHKPLTPEGGSSRSNVSRGGAASAHLYHVWWAFLRPPGHQWKSYLSYINAAAVEALADPVALSRLADLGFEAFPRDQQTPDALGALVKAGAEKWWPIMADYQRIEH